MNKPLISVVVPVYNVEGYIKKCLDSILSQDYPCFEIIVVDDGSTDNSGKIVDEYAQIYSEKIKVIHQKNSGLGGARNTGIEAAKGEYISFIDSDDTISSDFLSILFNAILSTNSQISVCNMIDHFSDGSFGDSLGSDGIKSNFSLSAAECGDIFNVTPSACNKLFKLSLFTENDVRFPKKVWYEDFRTIYKLFPLAKGIVFTGKPLYYYFQRDGSIMRNPNIDRNREIIDAMEDLISFYKSHNLFDKYYNELEFLTIQHVFWETSVRILQITGFHKLLGELRNYTFSNFPNALKNNKFKAFVDGKGIKGKIIYYCLKFKLYRLLHFLLKANKSA